MKALQIKTWGIHNNKINTKMEKNESTIKAEINEIKYPLSKQISRRDHQ